jgi:hypothetical protein
MRICNYGLQKGTTKMNFASNPDTAHCVPIYSTGTVDLLIPYSTGYSTFIVVESIPMMLVVPCSAIAAKNV